ncbi:MAG: leucine-rich repeat domain-containing protein [Acetobacter sp.]|nr:leucine-rich repeat domain-containing protein [Bacteroides sp.]MCM1341265.1 leucine-rich repeat domain-containing protein [Acetobacter sp.]MCM1433958.1 leucine-rich repeat domain-containing protein [Clostridiales bacterium]
MKRVFSKSMSLFLAMIMLVSCISCVSFESFAATSKTKKIDGISYTYVIEKGKAKITCIDAASKKSVKLPTKLGGKTVTEVDKYAAEWTKKVTSLTISSTITKLNGAAFEGFYNLKTINIGKSLKTIDKDAFPCSTITKFTVPKANKYFSAKNGSLYNKKQTKLVKFTVGKKTKKVSLGKKVTLIGDGAFANDKYLETISMPKVKTIGAGAFANCEKFKTSAIPASAAKIGDWAYRNTAVNKVTVPKTVTGMGYGCYSMCSKLTSADMSKTKLKTISKETFDYSTKLSTIKLPNTVTKIGNYAFSGTAIKSIKLSNKITSIGAGAFSWCQKLKSVTLPSKIKTVPSYIFSGCSALKSITIPSTVTKISADAFGASGLTSIKIPNSVTSIGRWAFGGCESLTSVTLPSKLKSIPSGLFEYCTKLKSVTIPSTVTKINDYAFYEAGITSIKIPNSVTSIGERAFAYCRALKSVTIPDSVTSIGEACFINNSSLSSVKLSEKLTAIKNDCFAETNLTSIVIPAGVKSIEEYAITGPFLKSVTIKGANTYIADSAFGYNTVTITAPKNSTAEKFALSWEFEFKTL